MTMKAVPFVAVTMLSLSAASSFAGTLTRTPSDSAFPAPDAGQTVFTSRGPVMTTGRFGEMQTTTALPGAAGQGLLIPNTNGTSTLIGPNGNATTVQNPSSP
jgi:hypothetical protein